MRSSRLSWKALGYASVAAMPLLATYGCSAGMGEGDEAQTTTEELGKAGSGVVFPPSAGAPGAGGGPGSAGGGLGDAGAAEFGGAPNFGGATGLAGAPGFGGSSGGSAGSFGNAGSGGQFPGEGGPSGFWQFDDCQAASTRLLDSSGNGRDAQRSAGTACTTGISGKAVQLDSAGDFVDVPGSTSISFERNLGIAAWVNPDAVIDTQTIIQKASSTHQSFALRIVNKRLEFSIELRDGTPIVASAPLKAKRWSHVAALFDGQFIFIFVDGQQVGQVSAKGRLRNVNGNVRIGNSGTTNQFLGKIDQVWFSNQAVTSSQLTQLACISNPPTLSVTPKTSGLVQPDTAVPYTITVKNADAGVCQDRTFQLFTGELPEGFQFQNDQGFQFGIKSGKKAVFPVTLTASADAAPGVHDIGFDVIDFTSFGNLHGSLRYELAAPTGCHVLSSRELMIRDLSVVEDPVRSVSTPGSKDPRNGAWTFGRLFQNLSPTAAKAPAVAERLFQTWLTDQKVNSFTIPARPAIQSEVLDRWPRNTDGSLDLSRAPLRLLAIVNRLDVRNLDQGNAGEGRFVFGVVGPFGADQFTVILEYHLPAKTEADVLEWANLWHKLGSLPFPSEQYNVALQAITDRFSSRNADPTKPNGSALSQLRSNEIALAPRWELREFGFGADGFLKPATVKLTPENTFDQTSTLASFVNANEASILIEKHVVPEKFAGVSFLGGSSFNDLVPWTAAGIKNNEARHKFSLNTCNGCHGPETNTSFLQVFPRELGQQAQLSPFLSGTVAFDPVTGAPRPLNDLARRRTDLEGLVCTPAPGAKSALAAGVAPVSIRQGQRQVH